ncbi:MAG TPA: hypothetical protein VGH28_22745 [Polyangiaceae bacterium]
MTASDGDAADHRAYALARVEGERLRLASQYLERHPNGAWAADVRAAFDAEEPRYYAWSEKSRAAAVDYLAWLPKGPHADAAVALVISFDEPMPEDEASRMVAAAHANEARLERAAEAREDAEETALESLRVGIDASIYGKKLDDDGDLARFLLAGRSVGKTPDRRTRYREFTIPARNGPIPRTLELTVQVEETGGLVTGVVVFGPQLFARMAEASLLREVAPAEAERYVRDAVDAIVRARGPGLHVRIAEDAVRIGPEK